MRLSWQGWHVALYRSNVRRQHKALAEGHYCNQLQRRSLPLLVAGCRERHALSFALNVHTRARAHTHTHVCHRYEHRRTDSALLWGTPSVNPSSFRPVFLLLPPSLISLPPPVSPIALCWYISVRQRWEKSERLKAAMEPLHVAVRRRLLLAWQDVHAALVMQKLTKAMADGCCFSCVYPRVFVCVCESEGRGSRFMRACMLAGHRASAVAALRWDPCLNACLHAHTHTRTHARVHTPHTLIATHSRTRYMRGLCSHKYRHQALRNSRLESDTGTDDMARGASPRQSVRRACVPCKYNVKSDYARDRRKERKMRRNLCGIYEGASRILTKWGQAVEEEMHRGVAMR